MRFGLRVMGVLACLIPLTSALPNPESAPIDVKIAADRELHRAMALEAETARERTEALYRRHEADFRRYARSICVGCGADTWKPSATASKPEGHPSATLRPTTPRRTTRQVRWSLSDVVRVRLLAGLIIEDFDLRL